MTGNLEDAAPGCVLFVAEAVTLAHVARLVTLATGMQAAGHRVALAADPRYAPIVGPLPFPVLEIRSMPAARFQHAITRGTPIFDFETLDRYVADDLALLERVSPRVVVGDFRISLGVSARLARVPYVNLTNAYWSPLALIRRVVPEFEWVRWLGVPAAQAAFDLFERAGYARHAAPVNRLRRKHGLPAIGHDFRLALTDGDITLYADVPQIIPTQPLPANQHFVGPVAWEPAVAPPAWWGRLAERRRERPLVYVSLGSSGPAAALQQVLDGLAPLDVDVIAATVADPASLRKPDNAQLAALLPGGRACALADLVICNGGSPGTYQALAQGKPVIGIAGNMDQFLNMAAVEDAGCGVLVRSRAASASAVGHLAERALSTPSLDSGARAIAGHVRASDPLRVLKDYVIPPL